MGAPGAWVLLSLLLLLLLVLQRPGNHGFSCPIVSGDVNWTREFDATCLNFSGQGLRLPRDQALRASRVEVLDLSGNGLRQLPLAFFAHLGNLKVLNVVNNQLDSVAGALAARCDLDLQADCSCVLAPWHQVRRDNCSGQQPLQCLRPASGAWQNLSAFMEVNCLPGLAPATLAGVVAGVVLLLGLLIAGLLLAWRFQKRRGARGQGSAKAWGAQEGPRPSLASQPRYSSQKPGPKVPKVPVDTWPRPAMPDYENVFLGEPSESCQWPAHGACAAEDGDFYMNYKGADPDPQPVYCNLESLGRAPRGEEEYVAPGH